MEAFSIITTSNMQTKNPNPRPFGDYFYTKEIIAGKIRGEISIHQIEIKTEESKINALGIFFKPSHSKTEIPLGLAAAPIQINPNLEELNSIQKMMAFLKTLYKIRVLRHIDKYLRENSHDILNVAESASSVPHLKAVKYDKGVIIHFQTGCPGYTLAHFIEELSEMSEEEISSSEKRFLALSVFKNIFAMLDNLPRKFHGDFHPTNILVSIQHEELEANVDQPIYTPPEIKTYAIDIGSIQNTISPNLKEGKLFYTKQDDLQNLFTHLKQWWSPQLNKLFGTTELTREGVLQMLELQDKATQQRSLSDIIQDYQLRRLSYLLNKNLEKHIDYEKEELQVLSEKIHTVYEIDEEGEGAPTVIMPYTTEEQKYL
jgi:hypothetical protein